MAYITIPALPLGTDLTGLEQFESVQSSVSVKLTANQIKTFVSKDPTFIVSDAATNTVSNAAVFEHETSGTAAAGFGVGVAFDAENNVGATVTGMELQAVCTDAVATTEDFDYVVRLTSEGALSEAMRLTSGKRLGIGTAAPAATFDGVTSDTNVSGVSTGLRISHVLSSGTAGNGIGSGIEFSAQNDVGVVKLGATIDAVEVDVASGVEDFDLVFGLMQNGAPVSEVARIRSNGNFGIGTPAASAKLDVLLTDANNSSPVTVARFAHGTSLLPATGIGTAIDLVTETSSNNFKVGGALYTESVNIAPAVESFDMAFALMINGIAGVEAMRITSDKFLGVNTTPQTTLHGFREDTATNTVTPVLRVAHGTTGIPAVGFGTSIQMESETAPGNFEIGGVIESVATSVSALTEEFNMVFKTMSAGAAATEKLRVGEVIYTPQPLGVGAIPTADANITVGGGTTTKAPLAIGFGSLLSTPYPGAIEYDNRNFYVTPAGSQRSVINAPQVFQLDANRVVANVTTIQSIFGKSVRVNALTRYQFQINATFQATSATAKNIGFAIDGTATLNELDYESTSFFAAATTTVTGAFMMSQNKTSGFATLQQASVASGAAAGFFTLRIRGSIDVLSSGYVDFSFNFSAAPTVGTVLGGSSVWLWPTGSTGGNTEIGDWI